MSKLLLERGHLRKLLVSLSKGKHSQCERDFPIRTYVIIMVACLSCFSFFCAKPKAGRSAQLPKLIFGGEALWPQRQQGSGWRRTGDLPTNTNRSQLQAFTLVSSSSRDNVDPLLGKKNSAYEWEHLMNVLYNPCASLVLKLPSACILLMNV